MPERLQLSRRRGYRKPEGAVVVSRPSKWGNPYTIEKWGRAYAVHGFRVALDEGRLIRFTIADVRAELAGKDLACWCPLPEPGEPDLCHAAVLLEYANQEGQTDDR